MLRANALEIKYSTSVNRIIFINMSQQFGGIMENYKGIMLCSRPSDQINLQSQRPFISRVHYDEPLGYNPVPKFHVAKPQRRPKPVLAKHKKWLSEYSRKIKDKQSEQSTKETKRTESNKSQVLSESKSIKKKEKQKPQWAQTEDQIKEKEDSEVDQLLSFAKQLDYEEFINDLEVKVMLEAIKSRVKEIQNNQGEKDKIVENYREKENVTQETRSINTHEGKLNNQTKSQQAKDDWDKSTTVHEKKLSVEEKLARHIAEEILKNNKYLRNLHSKTSLQRILEMEAKNQLQQQ